MVGSGVGVKLSNPSSHPQSAEREFFQFPFHRSKRSWEDGAIPAKKLSRAGLTPSDSMALWTQHPGAIGNHPLKSFGIGANSWSSGQNLFFGPQWMIPFLQSSDRHSYLRTIFSAAVCSGSKWTTRAGE